MRWIDRLRPETAFGIVAGAFGLAMAFVTPPMQTPDEPNHFYRTYQLSEGHLTGVRRTGANTYEYGGRVPASLGALAASFESAIGYRWERVRVGTIAAEFRRPLRPDVTRYESFPSPAVFSPVAYGPAVAGVTIGRLLSLPPIALLYLARLGTLGGYVAAGWLAVRLTPVGRWPAAVVLAGPMALFLAASASADPLTTAVAAVATAWALRCRVDAGVSPARAAIGLGGALVALALCKSVAYLPLAGLVWIVPVARWGRGRWLTPVAIVVVTAVTAAGWGAITHPQHLRERGDDPADQMAWVRAHPARYAGVFGRTLAGHGWQYVTEMVGSLGWRDTPLPPWLPPAFVGVVVALAVAFGEPVPLAAWPRAVAAAAVAASVGLIGLANYAVWNKIAAAEVEGLQGRYFLPLVLAGLAVIHRGSGRPVRPRWVVTFMVAVGLCTLLVLVRRYYLPDYAVTV